MGLPPGRKNPTNAEFEMMLDLFERQMRDLEIEYEKYFNGTERRPPIHGRRQLQHTARQVEQAYITNTALKFRARSLAQRLVTLQTYWNRVMRQIENGTYIRDLKKARQRQQAEEARRANDEPQRVYELDTDLGGFSFDDLADELAATFDAIQAIPSSTTSGEGMQPLNPRLGLEGLVGTSNAQPSNAQPTSQRNPQAMDDDPFRQQRQQQPHPQVGNRPSGYPQGGSTGYSPAGSPGAAPSVPASSDTDDAARRVYERYIAARRQCNQSTDISFDRLHQSMESQRHSIQKKKGIQNVDFDVVIKNGQAFLKPTTKE